MIEEGLIDSFDMISIIANINMEFGIDFSVAEITPENFATVETLYLFSISPITNITTVAKRVYKRSHLLDKK